MEQKDYRLAAIMYTDIAGFSRMMERDESGTLELLSFYNGLVSSIVGHNHGTIIKTIGDAVLVDFKNTVEALQSAMQIQDGLYDHNKAHGELPLLVRIGIHLGDIYFFEEDALGEGINIAARLQELARPGCICLSQDVYNQVLNKLEFRAERLGKVSLKNITKEIHAFEIASRNIEFDPDHGKLRPGYESGTYLHRQEGQTSPESGDSRSEPRDSPGRQVSDRSYTEEGSRSLMADIRRAILQDTKSMGRRLQVDEALSRYRSYGVEAEEVIASMAEQGLLVRSRPTGSDSAGPGGAGWPGGFDGQALGRNIRAAVEGIVGEIQRGVEQSMASPGEGQRHYSREYERHMERYRQRMERHALKHAMKHGGYGGERHWEQGADGHDDWKPEAEPKAATFEGYRDLLEQRAKKQRGGLLGHLWSFLAVNGVLWYLNLGVQHGGFLWAAIVSAGWGIGLLSSIVAALRSGAKLREIDAMPELEGEQLADYKRLNKARDSLAMHAASTLGVTVLFGVLQALIFGPHDFWFLIPIGAMVFGFISHILSYSATKPRLQKRLLTALGISGGWRNIFRQGQTRKRDEAGLGPYASLYREAESAKNAIVAQLRSGQGSPVDEDLVPSLQGYIGQVRLLAQSANEIDRLVEAIPMVDLGKDREGLRAKESSATSEVLKTEYRKSIAEIDKQEKAYQELKEQSEVVRLRLGSSVNQLKQMRIDIARMKAMPGPEGGAGLERLRHQTEELSQYLEDLRTSYDETRADPFAELERQEHEAQERSRLERGAGEASPGSDAP